MWLAHISCHVLRVLVSCYGPGITFGCVVLAKCVVHELVLWVVHESIIFIRLQISCVCVIVQSWAWTTAGPFRQADRKQESQGVHDQFFYYYFMPCKILTEALWQITHHVYWLRGMCEGIMYVCLYCTSLIVLHSVKYCSEQAIEQEVAQCVLFSMGDRYTHLRLVKAQLVIQKSFIHSEKPFLLYFPRPVRFNTKSGELVFAPQGRKAIGRHRKT